MARKRIVNSEMAASSGPASAVPVRRVASRRTILSKHAAENPDSGKNPSIPEPASPAYEPSHQEIAALAYSYWEQRGCQGGSSEEDWARAQHALRQRAAAAVA
jgi:hypothetical protein